MSVPISDGFNPPVHKTHHGADIPPAFFAGGFYNPQNNSDYLVRWVLLFSEEWDIL